MDNDILTTTSSVPSVPTQDTKTRSFTRRRGAPSAKKRSEAHREQKGQETMREYTRKLEEKLYMGFPMQESALAAMPRPQPESRNLPITTRAIGFAVQFSYRRLVRIYGQNVINRFINVH